MSENNGHAQAARDRLNAVAAQAGSRIAADELEPLNPAPITAGELIAENPHLRPYVLVDLAREGEVMNIISGAKVRKSWLVLSLLLCIATGRKWLGRFNTRQGRVLLIDNELHGCTIADRVKKVAFALGIKSEEYRDQIDVEVMRGKHAHFERLAGYFKQIKHGQYAVIVIDAFYKALPPGTDENSNSDITRIYEMIDGFTEMTGAMIILIHHASKGDQSTKSVTDVGAGAGSQSRASDVHLIMRPHEVDDCVTVEAAVRSSAPLDPFVMRWNFPTWEIDELLDPANLKRPTRRNAAAPKPEKEPKPAKITPEEFVAKYVTDEPRSSSSIVKLAMMDGVSSKWAEACVSAIRLRQLAHQWAVEKTNAVMLANRPQELFRHHTPLHPESPTPPVGGKRHRGEGRARGIGREES